MNEMSPVELRLEVSFRAVSDLKRDLIALPREQLIDYLARTGARTASTTQLWRMIVTQALNAQAARDRSKK
jgi:hypothetical protein